MLSIEAVGQEIANHFHPKVHITDCAWELTGLKAHGKGVNEAKVCDMMHHPALIAAMSAVLGRRLVVNDMPEGDLHRLSMAVYHPGCTCEQMSMGCIWW